MSTTKRTHIYHITHVDNLDSIISEGCLWCDSKRIERQLVTRSIAHEHIKQRRLNRLVPVSTGGNLGEYVPFNFCNRSVMLYAVFAGAVHNYRDGQNPIIHLVSTVETAIDSGRPWAFTERHAELHYAQYYDNVSGLQNIDWKVMPRKYWADSDDTKEKRQAEFLIYKWFPWSGILEIGVKTQQTKERVEQILTSSDSRPSVNLQPSWYY